MEKIIRHLRNSEHVLIASHVNPDGDAIGSLIAMGLSLEALNKKVTFYNESKIPTVYRFLPSVERIVQHTGETDTYDTAVVLDCGDVKRIGNLETETLNASPGYPTVINIDHHTTNTGFGNLQLIDTSACATTEIIYRLIGKMGVPMTSDIATSIYTGILTDTGSFRFSNTNKAAFEICNEMLARGVDPYNVAKHVYGRYSMGRLKLLNMALDSLEISYNGKLSMMTVTWDMLEETGTQNEDVDGFINYARRIEDVKIAVLIQECRNGNKSCPPFRAKEIADVPGKFHVSLRSDGAVDVAEIAADFGGGGHRTAAGFNIESTISELKSGIFTLADSIA
ncbi:bifunctional oligoribonuclease/PAP phosphatase NrnA [Desulfococcaceae bacterium HSG8]|nr:bifunctional oligoribonuclease/PAP phosphatase NrnA [Desulfococcaceae bacterium HSG8]